MYDNIKLLDCTLRDGGYVNEWNFGKNNIKEIIQELVKAKVDIVEVGFLRETNDYLPSDDITRWKKIKDIKKYLPEEKRETLFSAMCIHDFYNTDLLPDCTESCIDIIRVTFHNYDYKDGLDFCKRVIQKGYQVSCNPINIMGYSDSELLNLLKRINEIHPYAFSIVDTFGSMTEKDLDRFVSLVEHNLDPEISLGLHLHENLSQSFSLAQNFLNKHLHREVIVDASLMGMGRTPGNLALELIANYLNENFNKNYNIDYMLDTIEDHISALRGTSNWGYTPAYFLSAKYNLHRNYAEYYLSKGSLTHKDINHILGRIPEDKKSIFNKTIAEQYFEEYLRNNIDDKTSKKMLKDILDKKSILIIAPGKTLTTHGLKIKQIIQEKNPVIIAVNFIIEKFTVDYVFFSNNKRYEKYADLCKCPIIVTSNIDSDTPFYIDYNGLAEAFEQGCNSLVMLLHLLSDIGITKVMIAGADGYKNQENDYYDSSIHSFTNHDYNFNYYVKNAINRQDIKVEFITPSLYDIK